MISETNMSQLTIKQFAQDHEILVEDVCSRDIYYVEATTPVQEVRSIVEDTTVDWIFTTSNGHIIGAVARSTVYDALQYSDEPFNVGNSPHCESFTIQREKPSVF